MVENLQTLEDWELRKPILRESLWRLLGELPPVFTPDVKILAKVQREGFTLEKFTFENGANATVFGSVLIPDNLKDAAPAILYNHYHGSKYFLGKSEMLVDRGTEPAPGIALVNMGYVVLAIDAYAFGERQSQSPQAGDVGAATELNLFKKFLWEGATLWGMMLRDDLLALNYLVTRAEVDVSKIGTTGMSLGGSRSTWLAALDERIQVVVPVAQMTRYQNFDAHGAYGGHGIYYYVPGMLKSGIDMEYLVALAAPRPQLILIGDSDPLSPVDGVYEIDTFARHIYSLYEAENQFQTVIYEGVGHEYTSPMFNAMLNWFRQQL